MESSDGAAPDGFNASFRVDPRPDVEGVIAGTSPLAVEFDLCRSTADAGKELFYIYDWNFDHVADFIGSGEDCSRAHTYQHPGGSKAVTLEANVCVVNGDPRQQERSSLYFSCRPFTLSLGPAPSHKKPQNNGPCAGDLLNPGNGITGCWYTAPALNMTCPQVCASHGGFDAAASQHTGNQAGKHFWPAKADGSTWMSVECSSTDNNTNWGANGDVPDPGFSHTACYVNCACNE